MPPLHSSHVTYAAPNTPPPGVERRAMHGQAGHEQMGTTLEQGPGRQEGPTSTSTTLPSFSSFMATTAETREEPTTRASASRDTIRALETALSLVPGYGAPRNANRKPPLRPGLPTQTASAPLDSAVAAARWIDSGGRTKRAICFGCNRTFKKRDGRETHWARYTDCEARHIVAIQGTQYVVDYNEMLDIRRKSKARKARKELKRAQAANADVGGETPNA